MSSSRPLFLGAAIGSAAWLAAGPVLAHSGTGLADSFSTGFLHPLNGFDHLLAMVSVGLWGAVLGRPLLVILPLVFPAVMALGGILGMAHAPLPPVEIGIGLSVLILGGLIAAAFRAPVWAACLIVGVFAVFHGYAHGRELPSAADPVGYSVGFVLATGLLHMAGIGLGLVDRRPGGGVLIRSLGALIAASGVFFLYRAVVA